MQIVATKKNGRNAHLPHCLAHLSRHNHAAWGGVRDTKKASARRLVDFTYFSVNWQFGIPKTVMNHPRNY
jgi:hypothetical protein